MRYFKRFWGETRGDQYSDWGTSTWYFETDNKGEVLRQIEVYSNGTVLKYDNNKREDSYGGLSVDALDMDEFAPFEILFHQFE